MPQPWREKMSLKRNWKQRSSKPESIISKIGHLSHLRQTRIRSELARLRTMNELIKIGPILKKLKTFLKIT